MDTEQKQVAPYLPFSTLITALDHLAAVKIPNRIDHRTFPNMSSQSKSQVMSAFKFLGLMNDEGYPTPLLSDVAYKKDSRKEIMRQIIEEKYPDIVALDFASLSVTELDNALAGPQYNVQGETRKKAKTFLLKAAQYSGFTVHELLTKITRNRKRGTEKKANTGTPKSSVKLNWGANNNDNEPETPIQPPAKPRGSEKTVHLKSGAGSVTLLLDVDLMALEPGDEQDFVLRLRDLVRAYEKGLTASTEEIDKVEKEEGE